MRLIKFLLTTVMILGLTGCSKPNDKNTIKVGVIAGPESELMHAAAKVARNKYGLQVKIVEFSDYNMPNEALADGSIDANMFQHKAYLDAATKARKFKFLVIAKTFIYPMGLYSDNIKSLNELQDGAIVAIPNDPSNEARALLLLQHAKLIKLKPDTGATATVQDIIDNPKKLKIKEIGAAELPRTLPDVAIAAINTNYAIPAGLLPSRDALFVEGTSSPYVNLLVIRVSDKNKVALQTLIKALHSPEVIARAKDLFQGQAVAAWQ